MRQVVVSDYPMVDVEYLRDAFAGVAEVEAIDFTETPVAEAVNGAAGVVVDVRIPVPAEVFAEHPDLEVVARSSVGVDGVDVEAAADHGVEVTRVPEYCTDEVATHALALLMDGVREVSRYDRSTRAGEWDWGVGYPLHRIREATIGLLSFGPIARRTAEYLAAFDVVALDPFVDAETMAEYDVEKVDEEAFLDRIDHLSVHAPATEATRGMVDADWFQRLPEHAVVVNTGRGAVIDEDDLLAALEADEIAHAGLDVLCEEPPGADHPLVGREDVTVTPHAGWASVQARRELNDTVARHVRTVLEGGDVESLDGWVDPEADWL
jgi:D-3-phosphoglycerate dehydrogenase